VKDPLSGKMKQVDRPKEEWGVQERAEMWIISDEDWAAAQRRWTEIDGVFSRRRKGKNGFEGKQRNYVESHPTHLLSGSLKCGSCGGAIALVSGKGSGYHGCLNASCRSCETGSGGLGLWPGWTRSRHGKFQHTRREPVGTVRGKELENSLDRALFAGPRVAT
jgi:hypothetical protein